MSEAKERIWKIPWAHGVAAVSVEKPTPLVSIHSSVRSDLFALSVIPARTFARSAMDYSHLYQQPGYFYLRIA
jgi:hypothetical protein